MNISECYEKLGGNYAEVCTRLPSEKFIERMIGKFLQDESFADLCKELEAGNREEAFRAAHTLKGVCANLSFTKLFDSSSRLTEELRAETDVISEAAVEILAEVKSDYDVTVEAIREYLSQS